MSSSPSRDDGSLPIGAAIRLATRRLAGVTSPESVARTLVAWAAHVPPANLVMAPDLSKAQTTKLDDAMDAVTKGIPLQHITGVAYFRHETVRVGPGVFIPRPETECLAGWAMDYLHHASTTPQPVVVELCAGSGAMSLAIAHECPQAQVTAVELSDHALPYLRQNLVGTGVRIVPADMADALHDLDGHVNLVVVNPPYIPLPARDHLPPDVMHDPNMALFSGKDGLDAIRVVERTAWRLLASGGVVGCEHGDGQADAVMALFVDAWLDVSSHADLTSRPRFVAALRP